MNAQPLTYQELLALNNDALQRQMQEQALSQSDGVTIYKNEADVPGVCLNGAATDGQLRPVPTRAGSGQSDVCRDAGGATHHPLPVAQRDGD